MQADEVDPQAMAAVEQQDRLPMPHNRWGLKLLRGITKPAMWLQNRDLPAVGATRDYRIPGPGGALDSRLYLPNAGGPFPTVVFFHGGGYVLGSIETHEWVCRHLTRKSGCAVLSVDYRLAPEHPFPAAVEDAYAAVEWAASNTDTLDGAGRLAVAGDSAGGNLAAVSALMAVERDGPNIDHQALIYPSVGVDDEQASVQEHTGLVLSEADIEFFRNCYFPSDVHERNPYADPMQACDLAGMPAATVITAGFDPLRDGGRAYAARLEAAGVPTNYENFDAMVHGFATFREVDRAHDAIELVAEDLSASLGASVNG